MTAQNKNLLCFVDGVFKPDLSSFPVQGDETQGFSLSFADSLADPVELRFSTSEQTASQEIKTSLTIALDKNVSATFFERHLGAASPAHHALVVNVALAQHASLTHVKMMTGATALDLCTTAAIGPNAAYQCFSLLADGLQTSDLFSATLDETASCKLNGIMLLSGASRAAAQTTLRHAKPHGTSAQHYKTVLKDKARASFTGRVIVEKDAQKTDARQTSRALLLSDQAEMIAKPELEINADDVKCGHGSTIGDLDKTALFYLRARGIAEDDAKQLLIRAFIDDLLEVITHPALRAQADDIIGDWFHD